MTPLAMIKALGARIKHFRKLRKMSQALLGALMHVSQQVIAKYESGRAVLPAVRVPSLCEALGITATELFAGLPPIGVPCIAIAPSRHRNSPHTAKTPHPVSR